MTDAEIREAFAGVYEHLRTLHLLMTGTQAVSLATKDTLAELNPLQKSEKLYTDFHTARLNEAATIGAQITHVLEEKIKKFRAQ